MKTSTVDEIRSLTRFDAKTQTLIIYTDSGLYLPNDKEVKPGFLGPSSRVDIILRGIHDNKAYFVNNVRAMAVNWGYVLGWKFTLSAGSPPDYKESPYEEPDDRLCPQCKDTKEYDGGSILDITRRMI